MYHLGMGHAAARILARDDDYSNRVFGRYLDDAATWVVDSPCGSGDRIFKVPGGTYAGT